MSTFEIIRGVEGDSLALDDTRICGPKPWGGGHVIKTFHTDGIYEVISKDEYRKLMGENAKLREELAKWERLAAGIDLPEYPVTQFKPKDLERENVKLREQLDVAEHNQTRNAREYARLCHENDKLRELVQDIYGVMWACAEQRCTHRHDGCFRVHGNHGDICVSERCWYEDRMSELGIEV